MQLSPIPISCTSEMNSLLQITLCSSAASKKVGLSENNGKAFPKSTHHSGEACTDTLDTDFNAISLKKLRNSFGRQYFANWRKCKIAQCPWTAIRMSQMYVSLEYVFSWLALSEANSLSTWIKVSFIWIFDTVRRPLKEAFLASKIVILD